MVKRNKERASVTREMVEGSRQIWRALFEKIGKRSFKIGHSSTGTGWDPSYSVPSRILIPPPKPHGFIEKIKLFFTSFFFPGQTVAVIVGFPEVMRYAYAEDWLPSTRDFDQVFEITPDTFKVEILGEDQRTEKIREIFLEIEREFGFKCAFETVDSFSLKFHVLRV